MKSSIVFVAALLAHEARASCVFEEPAQLAAPDVVDGSLAPISVQRAPPAGLWWMHVPINDLGEACTDLAYLDDGTGATVGLDVVRAGPRVLALRVPVSLAPGTVLRMSADCGDERRIDLGRLEVIEGAPPSRPAPVLVLEDSALFEWIEPACNDAGQNAPDTRRFATFVTLSSETDADALLLDVWLLDDGAALPVEEGARAADALAWPATAETLLVRQDGVFDLHARATDPDTGATSDVVTKRIATPTASAASCGAAPLVSAPLLALIALLTSPRRKASTGFPALVLAVVAFGCSAPDEPGPPGAGVP